MTGEAKYKIGDRVHCQRDDSKNLNGFDFIGEVTWINNYGSEDDPYFEYKVTHAPKLFFSDQLMLIWENEIKGIVL